MDTHHLTIRQRIHTKRYKKWNRRTPEEKHPNKEETTKDNTMNTNHTFLSSRERKMLKRGKKKRKNHSGD
jgi:hypothetical protein